MDHAALVRVRQRARHRHRDPHRLVDGQLLLTIELRAQRFTFNERHHVEQEPVRFTAVEQWQQVRMLQVCRHLDLSQESLDAEHGAEFRLQNLDGDLAVMTQVSREINRCHAASSDLAVDRVSVG